jgi:hypothetical protein
MRVQSQPHIAFEDIHGGGRALAGFLAKDAQEVGRPFCGATRWVFAPFS